MQEILNHGLKLIEVSTETKFHQLSCLEQDIELNTELNKSKMLFLEKPMENVRKHKNIKLMSYYKRSISFLKQTKQQLNGFVTTFYKMKWKWPIFYKQASLFRFFYPKFQWNCNIWMMMWFNKSK